MKRKRPASLILTLLLIVMAIAAVTNTALSQQVIERHSNGATQIQNDGTTEIWRIDEPNVTRPMAPYPQVRFQPGDLVKVSAGGCVQTGGHGLTWKRYVDPSGPNSDRSYHGRVFIPGAMEGLPAESDPPISAAERMLTAQGKTYTVKPITNARSSHLWLGYEEEAYKDYKDNGYYSPDNGTNDQCKNGGNAYVIVTITHNNPPKPEVATDHAPIPPHMENYAAALFNDTVSFPGNGSSILNNLTSLYFFNKLKFSSGSIISSPSESKPRELVFFADTLVIDGRFSIDLSANQKNENGFLFIACRILKLKTGGQLDVRLSGTQGNQYRQIRFCTEQVYLDDRKVVDEGAVLQQVIRSAGDQASKIVFMQKLAKGERFSDRLRAAALQKEEVIDDSGKFIPLSISVGDLSRVGDIYKQFFIFFSKWVEQSYNDLYIKIGKDENHLDKIPAVKDFIKFRALNNYNNLADSSQKSITDLIFKINVQRDKIFKSDFQFERVIHTDRGDVKVMSSVTDNAIINYLPPSMALINPTMANGSPVLGYRVFDETQPSISMLDFDVKLYPDTRLKTTITNSLMESDEIVRSTFEEMKFNNLHLTGQDVSASQTTITSIGNNVFHIRLGLNNDNTSIFYRLFSEQPSDLFITGNWSNDNAKISGDIRIPVSFARIFNHSVNIKNGALLNNSKMPVVVEFFLKNSELVEKLPALSIDSGASFTNVYTGDDKNIDLPSDGMFFKLNPEKFGDYFEQIDNSDKFTQDLVIYNHISSSSNPSLDSLSGSLDNVELTVSYSIKGRDYQKIIQLSPANTMGNYFKLIIPKNSKDPVPVTINGKAIYENGEYTIKEVKLNDGETTYDLLKSQLIVK